MGAPGTIGRHDDVHMRLAIELAGRGRGFVSPNPPVGCVIASGVDVLGVGYHEKCGEAHAEVNALAAAGERAAGATAYVTLMPCSHTGRTPPCTEALLNAGIARVVVAVDDPNPVSGDGAAVLREAGVDVRVGCLAAEAAIPMRGFLKHCATGLPFVSLKYAMTLDGRTATHTGDSRWISCEESRALVQEMRSVSDAVLVGIGTVLADDPLLTVRDHEVRQPRRVVFDSTGRLPLSSRLLTEPGGEVIVLLGEGASEDAADALQMAGAHVLRVPAVPDGEYDRIDLHSALKALADLGIREALCEGGATFGGALLAQGLVDQMDVFVAPKLIGGNSVTSPQSSPGIDHMSDAWPVYDMTVVRSGVDFHIRGRVGAWHWMPGQCGT